MLFSEIYGSYFNVVNAILSEAADGTLTDMRLTEVVQKKAFAESVLSIPMALKNGEWPLIDKEFKTQIQHRPTMPLTTLQRRWMKAILQDPRIALFAPNQEGLEDVEPLYKPDVFVFFDQYLDGDPYEDPDYIACFRLILGAIRENRKIRISFSGHNGIYHSFRCIPYRLEYSVKDDKFRLLATGNHRSYTINMARVKSCELLEKYERSKFSEPQNRFCELTFRLRDERNALERVLLHFSHFEKETVRIDDKLYQIKLRYDNEDETELLIRILSFGPVLEVTAPAKFIELMRIRIQKQLQLITDTKNEEVEQ